MHRGLNQAESRAIYASWDQVLHASVFFVVWWLLRWCLRVSWAWLTLFAVIGGGAEEIHQFFMEGHVPSLEDWYADILGVAGAASIYLAGRGLAALQASVAERDAIMAPEWRELAAWGRHSFDCRWTFKVWRWEFYGVLLAGRERRALGRREQLVAHLSVWLLIACFALVSCAVVVSVLLLVQAALGWHVPAMLQEALRHFVA